MIMAKVKNKFQIMTKKQKILELKVIIIKQILTQIPIQMQIPHQIYFQLVQLKDMAIPL